MIRANAAIERETAYFNETLAGGKWRGMMTPEMGAGQWPSMRAVPPVLSEKDFEIKDAPTDGPPKVNLRRAPDTPPKIKNGFAQWFGVVSIEAEHFTRAVGKNGFAWNVIEGLGKTGDSVAVFPPKAVTFKDLLSAAPRLEYRFEINEPGRFDADFYLVPTQPLVPGNGLRIAVAIDDTAPQIITFDKDTEVSSPKWAQNILNQTTIGQTNFELAKGIHVLKIFAVDTGVVLDKIVLHSAALPASYFGPPETRVNKR
jgi:hypothetical protein